MRNENPLKHTPMVELRAALRTANANHEKFEREWYLRGDRIAELEAALRTIVDETARVDIDVLTVLVHVRHAADQALNGRR